MADILENMHYRYERKFVFQHKQAAYVERIVKNHPANFHEIFQQRHINNIYFDKPDLKAFTDNFEGNTHRQKVRIRWYGVTLANVEDPVLEIKIKEGELGLKKSFPLPNFKIAKGFGAQELLALLAKADLPASIREELVGLEPRLLNTYSRRYYRSFDQNFRFTVDQNLQFYKFSHQNNLFSYRLADYKNVILELKYDIAFAPLAAQICNPLPTRMTKFSKYVAGMELFYPQKV